MKFKELLGEKCWEALLFHKIVTIHVFLFNLLFQ